MAQTARLEDRPAFPPWPHYDEDEIEAAGAVLRSGKVNQWTGHHVRAFEEDYAAAVGVRHAAAVANGTLALELALRGLGIGAGDDVVVPSRTFVATASAVVAAGARPVVADVDLESGNVTAETVDAARTPDTKAFIPVHLGGWPCDMDALGDLAADRGLQWVEDCAQAHGATWNGRQVGSFGDVGAFSFCQDKIITTAGEGGMVTTDDEEVWKRMWAYKDHGKDHDAVFHQEHPPGFRWLHHSFGSNGRMTEVQAAIGRIQLGKLPAWLEARHRNAAILSQAMADTEAAIVPTPPGPARHAWYKYHFAVRPDRLRPGWDRDRIMQELARAGVPVTVGSCSEIHLEQCFARSGWASQTRLPNARHLSGTSLCLPVHPRLEPEHVEALAAAVEQVFRKAQA